MIYFLVLGVAVKMGGFTNLFLMFCVLFDFVCFVLVFFFGGGGWWFVCVCVFLAVFFFVFLLCLVGASTTTKIKKKARNKEEREKTRKTVFAGFGGTLGDRFLRRGGKQDTPPKKRKLKTKT